MNYPFSMEITEGQYIPALKMWRTSYSFFFSFFSLFLNWTGAWHPVKGTSLVSPSRPNAWDRGAMIQAPFVDVFASPRSNYPHLALSLTR